MTDSTSNANAAAPTNDAEEFTKPEQFCFAVEMWEDAPIVTLCPIQYFEENGYLDDQYYDEIRATMESNGFSQCMESTYEYDDQKATLETVTAKMVELGFKQHPGFDKYIAETQGDFSLDELMGAESERATEIDPAAITEPQSVLDASSDDEDSSEN